MAKQASLNKMNGKADGRAYFYSQNGGYQSRAINPGMSQRVKTAPEYANTRRNNAEYGVAAQYAGNVLSTFSGHWRFLLHKNIIGKMIKDVFAMITSNGGTWGERTLTNGQEQKLIPLLNKYSKHSLPDEVEQAFSGQAVWVKGDDYDTISINDNAGIFFPDGWGEQFRSAGATGCEFRLVAMKVPGIIHVDSTEGYVSSGGLQLRTLSTDIEEFGDGDTLWTQDFELGEGWNFDSFDQPMSIGILCLPFKQIGSTRYTMQELCSFKFVMPEKF